MEDQDPTIGQTPAAQTEAEAPTKPKDFPLPERPRLRPLEAFMMDNPVRDPAAPKLLVLRDPSGLAPDPISLPPLGAAVIELCDGDNTHEQIRAEFQRRYKSALGQASLEGLLKRLEDARMLDSPRFRAYAAEVFASFAKQTVRPAMFAGKSYPAEPAALRQQIEGHFARPNGPGLPAPGAHLDAAAPAAPRAIVAPHVDMARGGPAYAWAYRPLLLARELPDLIIVLGTNHNGMAPLCTLTRKDFETPLGAMETDVALLEELLTEAKGVSDALPSRLFVDEYQHRGEHSLEFQMLWLRYVLQRRQEAPGPGSASAAPSVPIEKTPKILPILCGSLHDFIIGMEKAGQHDPMLQDWPKSAYAPFVRVLRDVIQRRIDKGQRVLWLCAADLAHVGPRYGDKEPLSESDCDSLERRDRQTLQPVCQGDADAWFREIRRERDARRVCGLAPIYTMLKATSAPLANGQLRCYAQVQAEAGSVVSIASIVFA